MTQSTHTSTVLTLVSSPSLKLIAADLAERGLNLRTRELFLFLWRAKTQPQKLPMGLIFSERFLATELHCSVRTIQRALKVLTVQGLLRIQARTRQDGGGATNRYFPIWRPLAAARPTPTRAPLVAGASPDAPEAPVPIAPETVIVWPEMSGGPTTQCQGGEGPELQVGQALAGDFATTIDLNQDFQKSDQLIPGGPLLRFDTDTALQLFLLASLALNPARLQRWIQQYSLARIAQVAVWILSAPKGAIRHPGGWMHHALIQHWEAPRWVQEARATRQRTAQTILREQATQAQEIAEGEKIMAQQTTEEALWAEIAPRLDALPALYAYAAQLAQAALHSTFRHVFKPGSLTERTFVLRAAQERPELLQEVAAGTATA